jgi:hypothetical protein
MIYKRIVKALEVRFLTDTYFVKKEFKRRMGYKLDLKNPQSFSEKIQWLKLYYRNPILPKMVCKYESKKIVKDRVGKEYNMPTHSLYDRAQDIKLDLLPNKVALKVTHGSGKNIISLNKSELNEKEVQTFFKHALSKNYYLHSKEWAYKDVKPRVIVEQLVLEGDNQLPKDYKIHCFAGQPKFIEVDYQRYINHTRAYYDEAWNKLDFSHGKKPIHKEKIEKPESLGQMFEIAKKLSVGLPFLRVDFFYVNNKIYVGELTCYPGNGMEKFTDEKWDLKMGECLKLPL